MKRRTPILAMLLSACVIHAGPGPDTYPPAHSAEGVTASLFVATSVLHGELLEARDSALVVLTTDHVLLVPFAIIDSGSFANSNVVLGQRRQPLWEDRESIRLLSRYPQGTPPEALRRILAAKGQDLLVFMQ